MRYQIRGVTYGPGTAWPDAFHLIHRRVSSGQTEVHANTHDEKRTDRTDRRRAAGEGTDVAGVGRRDRQAGGVDHVGVVGSAPDTRRARQGPRRDARPRRVRGALAGGPAHAWR